MIVADTSWVVALRDPRDAHHLAAASVAEQIGDEPVVIAAATFAECLVAPAALDRLDDAATALRMAFEIEWPDDTAPRRWAQRRALSGLRLPDAIVLDTALHVGARAVATFDERLATRTREAGLAVLGAPR